MKVADTERIYYTDSHVKEFDAEVVSCQPDGEYYKVVLDRTAFFPEGGGQYGDRGVLNDIPVVDTKEKDGIIFHKTREALAVGSTVCGKINWELRFDRMQQHSGEHIVSGLVHERFGYENVGFHLADEYCTMDFNGPIEKDAMKEIEAMANEAVFANIPVAVTYPSKEELAEMEYRSKIEIEGQVRIVTVPGFDVCACCAPHVHYTGEIGLIKIVNMINHKGGVRVTMLCGRRALADYNIKLTNAKAIGLLLSEKENEIAGAVERLYEEHTALKSKMANLQNQMLAYKANEIDVSDDLVCVFDADLSGNGPRELMNLLLDKGAKICAVFAGTDESGYRYVMGSKTEDVRPLGKTLNETFAGRGGGKPEMVQGSLNGTEEEIAKWGRNIF